MSVILPVYNGEKTLGDTIKSLLEQTYTNFELLIGIDGSKDRSKAIALSFNDPRIQIFENTTNIGLGPNLNRLINRSHPKALYIAMAEQDDIYVKERLQWQIDVFKDQTKVGIVSGIAEFVSDKRTVLFPGLLVRGEQFLQHQDLFKYLYVYQLKVVNTCMVFKKSLFEDEHLEFPSTYGNHLIDWDFVLRCVLKTEIYGLPKVLVKMNRKTNNFSITKDRWQQKQAVRQFLKDYRKEFPELISRQTYTKALKEARKIELGYRNKFEIVIYAILYAIRYRDLYFIRYLVKRIKQYFK